MTLKTSASDIFEDLDPEERQEFKDKNREKDREYDLVELNNYKIIRPEYEALEGITKEHLNNYNDPEEYFSENKLDVKRGDVVNMDLSHELLTEIPEYINDLKELEELDLYGNKISEIENLDDLKNLKKLNLGGNQISNIENLDNLKNLQWLGLFYNQISEIDNPGDLKNLQWLDLRGNKISEIENLDDLKNLKILHLGFNKISKVENLEVLDSLEKINLEYNEIDYSDPDNKKELKKLEEKGIVIKE